ncbi:oxygenase MpaB family protein [Amycolatopsis ultiminotia]|uniref:Oxygenase MpaB family protein n=1 Tax=Amycolatopsis ultiminotia TaxID=543629 RepID=A0ABP6VGX0_9PSEU
MDEQVLFRQGGFGLVARSRGLAGLRVDEAQVARLREFAQQQDELADAVVDWLHRDGRGQQLVDRALAEGIDSVEGAPEELRAFFARAESTPYWVDAERLERGARAITRAGLLGLFPLGDLSLMGGYFASRATKSLVGTGEIEHSTARRLIETAAWWIDVTTPGALAQRGSGYQAALRIRLVHAHVRHAMNNRADWDYESWDRPVNHVQTAGTLLLFSLVYVSGTQLLGLRYSAREKADVLHLWRYLGWLMGVPEELLPANEDDAWRLLWLLAATEFIPDDDSKRLAKALVTSHEAIGADRGVAGKVLAHVNVRVHASVSRLVLGRDNADYLGLPDDLIAQAAVLVGAGTNFVAETLRPFVPGATTVQELLGGLGRRHYRHRVDQLLDRHPRTA